MLEKIEGRRRKGLQRMRGLDGISHSTDMSLNKLWEAWSATVHMVAKSQTQLSGFTFTLEGTGGRRCKNKQLGGCWSSPGRSELGGIR